MSKAPAGVIPHLQRVRPPGRASGETGEGRLVGGGGSSVTARWGGRVVWPDVIPRLSGSEQSVWANRAMSFDGMTLVRNSQQVPNPARGAIISKHRARIGRRHGPELESPRDASSDLTFKKGEVLSPIWEFRDRAAGDRESSVRARFVPKWSIARRNRGPEREISKNEAVLVSPRIPSVLLDPRNAGNAEKPPSSKVK